MPVCLLHHKNFLFDINCTRIKFLEKYQFFKRPGELFPFHSYYVSVLYTSSKKAIRAGDQNINTRKHPAILSCKGQSSKGTRRTHIMLINIAISNIHLSFMFHSPLLHYIPSLCTYSLYKLNFSTLRREIGVG